MIDFEKHRRPDRTIDLRSAVFENFPIDPNKEKSLCDFLRMVEHVFPIKSRQAAGLAIATAMKTAMQISDSTACNCGGCSKEKSAFQKWRDEQNHAEMQEKDIWNAAIDAVRKLEQPFVSVPPDAESFIKHASARNQSIEKLKEK